MTRETGEERALRVAAEGPRAYCRGVRAEIRRNYLLAGHDPDGRPPRLERLVTHIEEHLFEETLSVRAACRAAGIADSSIASELRSFTRYTVEQLVARLRIEAGIHLVLHTRIRVRRIGELLGYGCYATYLRAYTLWTGETPETTRRGGSEPLSSSDFTGLPQLLRIGSGVLETDEVHALRELLAKLYPGTFGVCQEAAG